jgi:hypothetical protein
MGFGGGFFMLAIVTGELELRMRVHGTGVQSTAKLKAKLARKERDKKRFLLPQSAL